MSIGIKRDPFLKTRNETSNRLLVKMETMGTNDGTYVDAGDQSFGQCFRPGKYLVSAWTAEKFDHGRLFAVGIIDLVADGVLIVSDCASRTFTTTIDGEMRLK